MKRLVQFFKDSVAEMKKVVWPSQSEVAASTRLVLISTAIFAVVLGVVDFLLVAGMDIVFR